MWTTRSKKLLAEIHRLHVDRINHIELTEFLLSAAETRRDESGLKEAASELVYFLLGTTFLVFFHHTKRLNVCLPVISVLG